MVSGYIFTERYFEGDGDKGKQEGFILAGTRARHVAYLVGIVCSCLAYRGPWVPFLASHKLRLLSSLGRKAGRSAT